MTQPEANGLLHECRVFCRYLCGSDPQPYVERKYVEAHEKVSGLTASTRFDRFLLGFVIRGPLYTKLADSYARFFASASVVRKKLVLLAAILETCPGASRFLGPMDSGNQFLLLLRMFGKGLLFLTSLLLAVIFLLPVQLVLEPGPKAQAVEH